jgi:O-antigen/teichoic acid export membrane protein
MADVVLILTLGQLINISTGMNDQILSITNYYKFSFYVSVFISVVLYVLLRVLIPQYGIYGAAWSNTITLVLFNAVKLVFIHRKLGMLPFSMRTLRVVVAALPALAAGYLLPRLFDAMANVYIGAMADAALRSLAIVLVYVAMLLWLKPSADLDEYLATVRKNKRLF